MKIQLLAVGTKMPTWVQLGFADYQSRFPKNFQLELTEIPAEKRSKNVDIPRILEKEGEQMIAQIPKGNFIIALDIPGINWNSFELAKQIENWKLAGRNISLLIGGPEGLSPTCKQIADQSWSLSALTLPHPLVRIIVAESLFRALSITENHPYHRE